MTLPSHTLLNRLLVTVALLWVGDAAAWGNLGHRITGFIAEPLLTAAAQRQVHVLLGDESLAVAATDMDTQRSSLSERWPRADKWHYNNEPVCSNRPTPCPDGDCATAQIKAFRKQLGDRRVSNSERATALRMLIHILGDIHQPLHMADNADRGGNKIAVKLSNNGERYNLHEVLDTVLIKELIGQQRTQAYAMSLMHRYQTKLSGWQHGDVAQWAQQSHELAVKHSYGDLPGFACGQMNDQVITLSASYVRNAENYIPEQLVKAGARIASVLNATLR